MPFPEASAALIDGLAAVAGLSLDSSALRRAADSSRRQVDQLIADNSEHQAMVRKLEESIDASEGNAMGVERCPRATRSRPSSSGSCGARSSSVAGMDRVGGERSNGDEEGHMKIDGGIGFDP